MILDSVSSLAIIINQKQFMKYEDTGGKLMKLYLVQHAQATAKEEDPRRPLSLQGYEDIRKIASHAADHCGIAVDRVVHSGKLRARQTAEVLASALNLPDPQQENDLEPLADPAIWAKRLAEGSEDMMLVSHLPYLARLASLLLAGDADQTIVRFQMGCVVALEREEGSAWALSWMIVPFIV